jgi:hypothetical protein
MPTAVFWLLPQPLPHLRFNLFVIGENICHPVVNRFTRQILPTVNRKYCFLNILCTESFYLYKTHKTTLLFSIILLKHRRRFDYSNKPLKMRMSVWYLYCHEVGLCCYLVTHTERLLHPLQLFYFHLWPIYWLSLVCCHLSDEKGVRYIAEQRRQAFIMRLQTACSVTIKWLSCVSAVCGPLTMWCAVVISSSISPSVLHISGRLV